MPMIGIVLQITGLLSDPGSAPAAQPSSLPQFSWNRSLPVEFVKVLIADAGATNVTLSHHVRNLLRKMLL
jgi:hypothetical protein